MNLFKLELVTIIVLFSSILTPKALTQQVDCGVSGALDGGVCGCQWGYADDGSCLNEPYGGGCPTNSGTYLVDYNDFFMDDQGNLEIIATTSNSDGNYGEGTLLASVGGNLPDGTQLQPASAITSSQPTVVASTSSSGVDLYSIPNSISGNLSFSNEIDWGCGLVSVVSFPYTFRISRSTYTKDYEGGGVCVYALDCPAGQTPTCGGQTFVQNEPCPFMYHLNAELVITNNGQITCSVIGLGTGSATKGKTCD
jgi:hypothetical protein